MIPRYQRILFAILLGSSVLMAAYLIYLHRRNYTDVKNADNTPIEAPAYSASEEVTLALANDSDGSVTATPRSLALPQQPAVRARALLEHLLAEYTLPHAKHAVGGGIAVDDVFLVPLPLGGANSASSSPAVALSKDADADPLTHASGTLALINLRSSWADAHPSGITTETLTVQSIVATLHDNLPEITKVRFLVDGKPRATLAGNVVLDRTYDTSDTVVQVEHAQ
jgi:hypothetical protein